MRAMGDSRNGGCQQPAPEGPEIWEATRSPASMTPLWKTRLCRFHAGTGCTHGSLCTFAHGLEELRKAPDFTRTSICPELLRNGTCRRGSSCPYAHSRAELRAEPGILKTRMCDFHLRGSCRADNLCRFAHQVEELGAQICNMDDVLMDDEVPPPPMPPMPRTPSALVSGTTARLPSEASGSYFGGPPTSSDWSQGSGFSSRSAARTFRKESRALVKAVAEAALPGDIEDRMAPLYRDGGCQGEEDNSIPAVPEAEAPHPFSRGAARTAEYETYGEASGSGSSSQRLPPSQALQLVADGGRGGRDPPRYEHRVHEAIAWRFQELARLWLELEARGVPEVFAMQGEPELLQLQADVESLLQRLRAITAEVTTERI
mmetsp:Transcript_36527/g.79988  ORF Transcript_36527/g.79988 Transcript_36527/m.79988 type:complete len:374 (+) Transcript_36527:138-1259(+)